MAHYYRQKALMYFEGPITSGAHHATPALILNAPRLPFGQVYYSGLSDRRLRIRMHGRRKLMPGSIPQQEEHID